MAGGLELLNVVENRVVLGLEVFGQFIRNSFVAKA